MNMDEVLEREWNYLAPHENKAITISNTARNLSDFKVLPRRYGNHTAVVCLLINNRDFLRKTIAFFDGKVDTIYMDVEQKQDIDLYQESKQLIQQSELITVKPNDIAIESCDLLLRNMFADHLTHKNIAILGTGNLASKMALRLAERQASVYMEGRSALKEQKITNGINSFLPAYTSPILTMDEWDQAVSFDAIVSFLSGPYWAEEELFLSISNKTKIIDGGISNFSSKFIQKLLDTGVQVTRLDVRFALPYQFLDSMEDTMAFYRDVYGKKSISDHCMVAGGYIGQEGAVIVDRIKQPTQIIGIADGMGGVKDTDHLTNEDNQALEMIQDTFKATN